MDKWVRSKVVNAINLTIDFCALIYFLVSPSCKETYPSGIANYAKSLVFQHTFPENTSICGGGGECFHKGSGGQDFQICWMNVI